MKIQTLTLLSSVLFSTHALAQAVPSEADLFGGSSEEAPKTEKKVDGKTSTEKAEPKKLEANSQELAALKDTLDIGGRLELRANANKVDDQRFQESPQSQSKTADIYFDTRPNKDVRAFLRMRFYEDSQRTATNTETVTSTEKSSTNTSIQSAIDELWMKWDIADTLFVTAGKQHVKWGRGRFWNPIDFTAKEVRDPFALYDRRLGQEMIKLHLPFEKAGHNFYLIGQFDELSRNDDVGAAGRAEFSVGDNGELAFSVQTKRNQTLRYGIDTGFGLGNFDIGFESAWLTRDTKARYEGELDIANLKFPTENFDSKKVYNQTVLNLEYVWKYSDDDSLNLGIEGFRNELGYDSRLLEFYSLLNGNSKLLYAGREYLAAYARLAAPGNWNDTSFIVNAIQNRSDETALARLTMTHTFLKQITLEAYVSRCFGDYGELCFKVPDSIFQGISALPEPIKSNLEPLVASLPRKTTRTVFGGSLSMSF